MCLFCQGQCGGSVEYIANYAAIMGAPYCIMLISKLKLLKHKKNTITQLSNLKKLNINNKHKASK